MRGRKEGRKRVRRRGSLEEYVKQKVSGGLKDVKGSGKATKKERGRKEGEKGRMREGICRMDESLKDMKGRERNTEEGKERGRNDGKRTG